MKKLHLSVTLFLFSISCSVIKAQGISINAGGTPPDNSAMLDVNANNKGLLMPRLSTVERDAIANPATGLFIFNTDCNVVNYNAGTPGNPNWATMNASNVLAAGVSIAANPVGAICAGTSVTFTATPSQNNLSPNYQWQVNGQNVGNNSTAYTTSNLNSGDVVTCILTSSAPCVTGSPATSNAITMLVNLVPSITGTTPTGFCSGSAVTVSASANLGTINWYANSTGGSSLSSGASFTVSGLTSTTTYYVDATANGCTTSSRTGVTATFYPGSPGQPGAITGSTAVRQDSTATYSISALPNTATYAWTVTSGIITAGQGTDSITVAWGNSANTGSVSVAATNPCGTGAAQSLNVYMGGATFSYTGSAQSIVFPAWISSVTITAYGAQGGNSNGGLGGSATGTLSVTPGEVLYVYVGGQNSFNGGGAGAGSGGNGGDESDVRVGGNSINNWAIVAGGGGGGSSNNSTGGGAGGGGNGCANGAGGAGGAEPYAPYSSAGGPGTCTSGGAGGSSSSGWSGGGGGGGLTSGGGGSGGGGYGNSGGDGMQGVGGSRGANTNNACGTGTGCGGGGGYYGGGGTSDGQCSPGGGGGGSSWASASMTNTSFSGGVQSGNGQVVMTW